MSTHPGAESAANSLAEALAIRSIDLPPEQVERLNRYCALVWDWNSKLNLTRHTDYDKFVSRDIVDSRVIASHLEDSERVLDVGTGAGVPGIVLAILRPDLSVALCESVAKKARVVQQIVGALELPVAVFHARAEDLLEHERYDSLVARAVAPLAKLLTWFKPRWGAFDRLLVVKGPGWISDRQVARERNLLAGLRLRKLESWPLPGSESESVLLEIRPKE